MNSDFAEYWIVRRSLSSGGHSADPLADDDTEVVGARLDRAIQYSRAVRDGIERPRRTGYPLSRV